MNTSSKHVKHEVNNSGLSFALYDSMTFYPNNQSPRRILLPNADSESLGFAAL